MSPAQPHHRTGTEAGRHTPPAPPEPSDAQDLELAEACKRGDQQAWARLIHRYQDRLFSVCLRMVHNRDMAADMTQDALVKVIQGIGSFDGRAKLSTWMIRVTMNVCLSKLRSEKLRRHASLDADQDDRSASPMEGPRTRSQPAQAREPGTGPDVEAREERERLLVALSHLDPDQRAVLILCDCRGLAYEQIAEVLGVAVGTVKSRVFRARTALRDTMETLARTPARRSE